MGIITVYALRTDDFWTAVLWDSGALVTGLAAIVLLVLIGEGLHRWGGIRPVNTRRIVHAGTGCLVAFFPLLFDHAAAVYVLGTVFVITNGWFQQRGLIAGLHGMERRSWGTVSFPLALLIVLPFAWAPDRVFALQTAFLILGICDPAASWVGEHTADRAAWRIAPTGKSLPGSLTFFVLAAVVTLGAALLLPGWPEGLRSPDTLGAVVVIVPAVAAVVELLGSEGWDNLFVGVGITVLLVVWQQHPEWTVALLWSCGAGFLFAMIALRLRYLTVSGAAAGGLFAASLLGFGGWGWALPGFAFFFSSSALSKARRRYGQSRIHVSGEDRRTAAQVYANGGAAWILLTAHALEPTPFLYWGFLGAVAAATADTWASEIGPLSREIPRMITSGRRVFRGRSGAVSVSGTAAGLAGAGLIWTAAYLTGDASVGSTDPWSGLLIVGVSGAVGSLADSLAGATIQAVYRDRRTGRLLEDAPPDQTAVRVHGWPWIDNQRVNWICTAVGAASAGGLSLLV